jgi:hypothetical protein
LHDDSLALASPLPAGVSDEQSHNRAAWVQASREYQYDSQWYEMSVA